MNSQLTNEERGRYGQQASSFAPNQIVYSLTSVEAIIRDRELNSRLEEVNVQYNHIYKRSNETAICRNPDQIDFVKLGDMPHLVGCPACRRVLDAWQDCLAEGLRGL